MAIEQVPTFKRKAIEKIYAKCSLHFDIVKNCIIFSPIKV